MSRVVARIRIAAPALRNRVAAATETARVFRHRNAPRAGARNDMREDLAVLTCQVAPCSPVESAVLAPHACVCPTCSEPESDEAAREAARVEAEMDADWEADRADFARSSRRDTDQFPE